MKAFRHLLKVYARNILYIIFGITALVQIEMFSELFSTLK